MLLLHVLRKNKCVARGVCLRDTYYDVRACILHSDLTHHGANVAYMWHIGVMMSSLLNCYMLVTSP